MDKLAVAGDKIVLQPTGFLWQAWDGKLPLQGSNIITSEGKSAVLEKDVMLAALQGTGKMYVAPPFATPGSIISLQLTIIPVSLSPSVSIMGQGVVTGGTMGTYTATMVPAMNPQGVPDPLVTKMGQWTIETTSQSSFRSGLPVPLETGKDGAGEGESESDEAKADGHWIAVSVEDLEGNPLANQRLSLELCNGEVVQRVLSDSGAVRIDGIEIDEDLTDRTCIARLVFDPSRVPVRGEPNGSIAIQVVDDDGEPFAGRDVLLTLPDGTVLRRTLDEAGRTRFVGVPDGARCSFEIVPAQVQLEFTLLDEEGASLAEKSFVVTDSTGTEVKGVTDDEGFASVTVAEGEVEVRVDFEAAEGKSAKDEAGTGDDALDEDGSEGDDGSDTDEDEDESHKMFVLEAPSALFRLESAVVMPEGEDPSADSHDSVRSVDLFALALRFNDEQPDKSMFVAGHADTSGDFDANVVLSAQRANMVLSVISGDRETFVNLADASHTIADYKQILSWCTTEFPEIFNCDPGKIDDVEFTGIEPLRRFQAQYNNASETFGGAAAISVDGSIGPETWGALFDVYQEAIRVELDETREKLQELQSNLRFVDDGRKALGFGETQPAVGAGEDGRREQANRRVEILFFADEAEPDLATAEVDPANCNIYVDPFEREQIDTSSAKDGAFVKQDLIIPVDLALDLSEGGPRGLAVFDSKGNEVLRLQPGDANVREDAERRLRFFDLLELRKGIFDIHQLIGDASLLVLSGVAVTKNGVSVGGEQLESGDDTPTPDHDPDVREEEEIDDPSLPIC